VAASFRVASLCAGIGGLDLGIGLAAPGARSVLYVERDGFAASVLLARMETADLEPAPIWCGDLAAVDWRAWRGHVDLLAAGFPCQPHSLAGKRKGIEDERWIWGDIVAAIDGCACQYVFLENVPGLVTSSGGESFGEVLEDLASLGFDLEWLVLAARDVGASHKRDRIFILGRRRVADTNRERLQQRGIGELLDHERAPFGDDAHGRDPQALGDADRPDHERSGGRDGVAREAGRGQSDGDQRERYGRTSHDPSALFPPGPSDLDGWAQWLAACPGTEPAVRRDAHGVPGGVDRIDRLRALGNAVVPLQAGVAFRVLAHRFGLDLG
jgi:DNA (cytosine-5)-methyltransferase 1